jgi:hypothetical protein
MNALLNHARVVTPVLVATFLTAACDVSSVPTRPTSAPGTAAIAPLVNGAAEISEFEVCKEYAGTVGPPVTINVTVDFDGNGSIDVTNSLVLSDGQCGIAHSYRQEGSNNGLQIQRVTVTEQEPSGYTPSYVLTTRTQAGTTAGPSTPGNSASGDMISNPDNGFLVVFTNTAQPVSLTNGRFTGGGSQVVGEARITRGLTIHCDLLLSNNLEVNWGGNQFHMTEHLTTLECSDDPNITQAPPKAPLDTLVGVGTGRYNGQPGYTIEFKLVDAGEPGSNDMAALKIYEAANPANVVLDIPLQLLTTGNLQAHYDQPHK